MQYLQPDENQTWLSIAVFESLLNEIHGRSNVEVTFDDGNYSDIDIALPALLRYGMKASFFVPAGQLDVSGYLSKSDVRELAHAGMKIGSHGMYHRDWTKLNDEELKDEIYTSKELLGDILNRPINETACPFGFYNRRVLYHLRKAGYRKVYTSDRGLARSDAWIQPRNTLFSFNSPESVKSIIKQKKFGTKELIRNVKLLWKRWR